MKTKRFASIALITSIIFCGYLSIQASPLTDKEVRASIEWIETTHDFGKIIYNKPVKAEFEFKNNSLVPLVINSVKPSCGCTVAKYPKEPVQPGKTAKIYVGYNAKSLGYFTKSILVNSNTAEGRTTLFIKGEVIKK